MNVPGIVVVAREPARQIVGGVEVRQHEALKLGLRFVLAHVASIRVQTTPEKILFPTE